MAVNNIVEPGYSAFNTPTGGHMRLSGLFGNYMDAQRAVDQLESIGIPRSNISVFYRKEGENVVDTGDGGTKAAEGAGYGSAVGGTIGAIFGAAVAAVTAISIPGAGILIAGPIAGALAGAGAGGLTGGLLGALTGAGIPDETARTYQTGIERGGVVVVVDAPEHLVPEARQILDSFNA